MRTVCLRWSVTNTEYKQAHLAIRNNGDSLPESLLRYYFLFSKQRVSVCICDTEMPSGDALRFELKRPKYDNNCCMLIGFLQWCSCCDSYHLCFTCSFFRHLIQCVRAIHKININLYSSEHLSNQLLVFELFWQISKWNWKLSSVSLARDSFELHLKKNHCELGEYPVIISPWILARSQHHPAASSLA